MIKLNLTLGNSFFEHFYLAYSDDFGEALPKIRQHRIVLNKKIVDYYKECAEAKGMTGVVQTLLPSLMNSSEHSVFEKECGEEKIVDELMAVSMKQKKKILLAEKSEVKKAKRGVNLYCVDDIVNKEGCLLNLYSLPVTSRYIPPKANVESYKTWLRNWIEGEKKVVIRDRYLLGNLQSFKEHFLPLFDKGMDIEIQTDVDVSQNVLNQFDLSDYADFNIGVVRCEKMHERVMIFEKFQIVIGIGVAIFSGDWNLTKESFISISKITFMDANKTIIQRLR